MRFGAGIWLFGQFVDRYATDAYGPPVSTLEAIERAGAVGGLEVLDINYPFSDPDITVEEVQRALGAAGLRTWCITPHIYTREFTAGAFTNPDPAVRRRAQEICEAGVDAARRLGSGTVKLWPGQDGYDYPFQADYRQLWRLELEGVRAVADMDADVRVAIEYKTKEPRTHISLSTAARTLVGILSLDRDDVGVVVDLGQSMFSQ
jgi:xylose isomerase